MLTEVAVDDLGFGGVQPAHALGHVQSHAHPLPHAQIQRWIP